MNVKIRKVKTIEKSDSGALVFHLSSTAANDELKFSINEYKSESFLEKRELKMLEHLYNDMIERTFLLNENGSLIGQITGHFRLVSASPKKQQENIKLNPVLT